MTLRTLLVATGLAGLVGMLPACSSEASDDSSSASAAADTTDMILEGSVASGQAVIVNYDPAAYHNDANALPFVGVRLVPGDQPAAADQSVAPKPISIEVTGQFPGSPNVLVLDGDLKVVASTKGVATGDVARASLVVPASAGARIVLVRDDAWVRPMPFTVSIAQ